MALEKLPYEPKKERQYKVKFREPFDQLDEFAFCEVSLPSCYKTNGGIKWNDMVFRMYDFVSPSTSQAIRNGLNALKTLDDPTVEVSIYLMGPVGDTVSEWIIKGEIDSVDFGELRMDSGDPLIVSLHLKVRYVILNY